MMMMMKMTPTLIMRVCMIWDDGGDDDTSNDNENSDDPGCVM